MDFSLTDIVGYLASILLMASFMMKDIVRLRIVNTLACILFVIYGFMLATAWPIIVSNAFIVLANFWHLSRPKKLS